jgi:hypothetical protein
VTKWLNSKGITAFIFRYRTSHFLTDNVGKEYAEKAGKDSPEEIVRKVQPFIALVSKCPRYGKAESRT